MWLPFDELRKKVLNYIDRPDFEFTAESLANDLELTIFEANMIIKYLSRTEHRIKRISSGANPRWTIK